MARLMGLRKPTCADCKEPAVAELQADNGGLIGFYCAVHANPALEATKDKPKGKS